MRIRRLLIILFLLGTSLSFSQTNLDVFNLSNLSSVKVSSLTDKDIEKVKTEMQKRNISLFDLEKMALAKGMSPTEFAVLKQRIQQGSIQNNIQTSSNSSQEVNMAETANVVEANNPKPATLTDSTIFGSEIFSNPSLSFEPNLNLATPANYILGPRDELQIVIYGTQQYSERVQINKEGRVTLSNIGQLHLAGQTFSAAEMLIRKSASKIYNTLRSGESELSITLTNIRTINVTIIGAKAPGNYSLSSLSTVFNALHVAGGPNDNGSYRKIELVRGNKIIRVIDIYKFLVTGDQTDNVNLQDNDVIHIPVYEKRVQITGKIKRPGIFELKGKETFNDLLKYCSGFTESAFKSSVKLFQKTEKEFKVMDLPQQQYISYIPKSGDVFKVSGILNRYENRVTVKGAVYRPDVYALKDSMTIKDLIKSADGLTEDAYWDHALLIREKEDRIKEVVGVDLNAVMNTPAANLLLKREDELIISSKFDLLEKFIVTINGEVRDPGEYSYIEELTLYDLIIRAGGFKESASKRIEIARMVKSDSIIEGATTSSEIIRLEFSGDIRDQAKNLRLQPYDIVEVRKMPTYEKTVPVYVSGEAVYPGEYILSRKDERILDVIERAGGLDAEANPDGIKVIRRLDNIQTEKKEQVEVIIPIDYVYIKRHPKSRNNIRVREKDKIVISKKSGVVKVIGQVSLNSEIPVKGRKGVRYYISAVGGFLDSANTKRVYVVYANGMAKRTKNYVLFKVYPKVERGAQIVVPKKPVGERRDIREVLATSSILTSIAGMTILIIKTLAP
jgi:protein involved in polysaccharide export with SLBB domain